MCNRKLDILAAGKNAHIELSPVLAGPGRAELRLSPGYI